MNFEKLQKAEQSLQTITAQKQSVQAQLGECESALREVNDDSYKIIGNIMVKQSKDTLEQELQDKQKKLEKHLEIFSREEEKLRADIADMQKQLMEEK